MINHIQLFDENLLFYIQEHLKSPALDRIMVFITSLGNAGAIWIAVAFLLLARRKTQKCGLALICAISLVFLLGDGFMKPLFSRIRPCNKYTEFALLIQRPLSHSFPSGHTMAAFASSTILNYYYPRIGTVTYLFATLIAFSRLYLFVHYPTDILGGILFGCLSSFALLYILNKLYCLTDSYKPSVNPRR